jgi:hypothetical protein
MMKPRAALSLLISTSVFLANGSTARAGMPSISLTDIARMRFQTISFFLVCFLICALFLQKTWNGLTRDFPRLPRLSYGRALGALSLWGLLFVLILTMISGARELMTPGAWEKQGLTYKLSSNSKETPPSSDLINETVRQTALDRLRIVLWTYAKSHDGSFPARGMESDIPEEAWRIPGPSMMSYRYVPGLTIGQGAAILAYEPAIFGSDQLVLRTDGKIVPMTGDAIHRSLSAGSEP